MALWLPVSVAAVVVLLVAWWRWQRGEGRQRLLRCGAQIPGPPALPLLGNILDVGIDPTDLLRRGRYFWERYGPLFRLWLGPYHLAVFLLDPRDIEIMLSSSKNLKKPFNYSFVESWLGQGLLTSTGKRWHNHRKIITPAFHFNILEKYLEIFNKQGDILISMLKEKKEGKAFDICPLINHYTQDVICESVMGVKIHAQTEGNNSPYVRAVKGMCQIVMKRSIRPWLFLNSIYNLSPSRREEKRLLEILHSTTNNVIRERRSQLSDIPEMSEESVDDRGIKRKRAFLDHLLSSEDCKILSDTDIREEVDTFMFEGHDTTASAISFAIMELSRRHDIQEKVYNELKEIACDNGDLLLSFETLKKLKYLEQVIKEVLRLYPSVPLYGRELTEDLKLPSKSVTLPPGTSIVIFPNIIHRQPQYFPDPDVFNPDNFSSDVVLKRHPFAYVPFSAGSRNCIGQKFAMLEIKATLAKIIWNFSLQIDPKFELELIPELTLKSKHGVNLSLTRRLH